MLAGTLLYVEQKVRRRDICSANGNRTRIKALRGLRPKPLDDSERQNQINFVNMFPIESCKAVIFHLPYDQLYDHLQIRKDRIRV